MAQSNDNFTEGVKKLLGPISQLMMLPDADVDFLSNLQLVIRNRVMSQYMQAAQLGPGGAPGMPGAGGPPMPGSPMAPDGAVPGLGLGPVPPAEMGPGGGMGGGASGITPPNADELRRVLSAGAGG